MNKIGLFFILLVALGLAAHDPFHQFTDESIALLERDQLTESEQLIVTGVEQGIKRVTGGVLITVAVVAMMVCGIFNSYMKPPLPIAISISGACLLATGILLIYMSF